MEYDWSIHSESRFWGVVLGVPQLIWQAVRAFVACYHTRATFAHAGYVAPTALHHGLAFPGGIQFLGGYQVSLFCYKGSAIVV